MNNMLKYEIIRTNRKTLALYVKKDGSVEVRAPLRTSVKYIESFIERKKEWIFKTQNLILERVEKKEVIKLSEEEVKKYKKHAKTIFLEKCGFFSGIMGIQHGNIKVNSAKTRWGSCNSKGNINFTYRLLFAPPELVDYVVVHELAHIRELNHSPRFWKIVEEIMPDYKTRKKLLREYQHQVEINGG